MVGKERMASLGFPVVPSQARAMGTPVLPIRDPSRAVAVSGNSMHFSCVAVAQMISLTCFSPKDWNQEGTDHNSWRSLARNLLARAVEKMNVLSQNMQTMCFCSSKLCRRLQSVHWTRMCNWDFTFAMFIDYNSLNIIVAVFRRSTPSIVWSDPVSPWEKKWFTHLRAQDQMDQKVKSQT